MEVFTLDLATLPAGRSELMVEVSPARLGLEPTEWEGEIRGRLVVEKSGEQVTVRGTLEAVTNLECVRCLGPARLPLRVPFQVFADRSAGRGGSAEEAELERDDYMRFHDGRRLDLAEEAREALLLEVPMTPRCRPDCRGLCPRCGADLNQGQCGCASQAG